MSRKTATTLGKFSLLLSTTAAFLACTSDADPEKPAGETDGETPTSYEFESRFQEGESSVSYSGQILRHLLISDLATFIKGLDEEIESNADFDPTTVEASLLGF